MTLKPFLALALAALATVTADDTNTPIRVERPADIYSTPVALRVMVSFSTNRVTNILGVLSTTLVTCPECGSKVFRQVSTKTAYDVIYLNAVSASGSNSMRIATGSATNWVSTNLIPRTVQPYASPGWVVPPPTNR